MIERLRRDAALLLPVMLLLTAMLPWPSTAAVEEFIRYASYDSMSLSPEGAYVAVTHRKDSTEYLSVFSLPDLELVSSTRFSGYLGIGSLIWATEKRLLIQPARRHPTRDDFKSPTGEIAAMDVDGGNRAMLFGFRAGVGQIGILTRKRQSTSAWAQVIDRLPDDEDHVLIQTMGYGREGMKNEVLLLDIEDGETRIIAHSPLNNGQFVPDLDHQINLVAGENSAGDFEVYSRKTGGRFELLHTAELNAGAIVPLLPSTTDGYYLFADSATNPMRGLVAWNPVTDDRLEVFRHPNVDYDRLFVAPYPEVWAIRYVDHFPYYHYPDPSHPFVALHESLRAMFKQDDVVIFDQSEDLSLALARTMGPKNPGTYFLLDVAHGKLLHELETRPWLRDTVLADVEPIEVVARDGLTIRSYLTLPASSSEQLPMVVLVHGGPHGVDDQWGFDSEAQLFAAHGYAVLQVNFRGSGGRGQEFLAAGYGKWGVEMQDDITDSVRFAIAEGIADPDRICIYGASYGGYSALVGAYRDPDLYRCAIGYAGIYDLPLMFHRGDIPEAESGVNFLTSVLGTDQTDLKARSPVFNADRIKARVMLIHGKLDERAPYVHAKRMRQALIDAGRPPEWLVENREGHGFRDDDNRLAMYTALLEFLDQSLMPATR